MSAQIGTQLHGELAKVQDEEHRLMGESHRLRSALRRARATARIASTLHQDLFCPMQRAPATASEACPLGDAASGTAAAAGEADDATEAAALRQQLGNAEALAAQRVAEVAELKSRLEVQESLETQVKKLAAQLEPQTDGGNRVASRVAKPAAEISELRQRIAHAESQVQQLRAARAPGASARMPGSGCPTPLSQKGEIRQLQQLDSLALRLHEEIRCRRSSGSAASAASSPMHRFPQAASRCGSYISRMSTKSEVLEQQIDGFYKRFMIRRGGLGPQHAS